MLTRMICRMRTQQKRLSKLYNLMDYRIVSGASKVVMRLVGWESTKGSSGWQKR